MPDQVEHDSTDHLKQQHWGPVAGFGAFLEFRIGQEFLKLQRPFRLDGRIQSPIKHLDVLAVRDYRFHLVRCQVHQALGKRISIILLGFIKPVVLPVAKIFLKKLHESLECWLRGRFELVRHKVQIRHSPVTDFIAKICIWRKQNPLLPLLRTRRRTHLRQGSKPPGDYRRSFLELRNILRFL